MTSARPRMAACAAGLALALLAGCGPGREPAAPVHRALARVEIDATGGGRPFSPLLFGMHIEWVDDGQGLLAADSPALREDVLALLRPLRIPLFRFPGGIHADYYDWRLGAGPPGRRGASPDIFSGETKPHRFGTPELLALLRATGAEALITANYGTGSPELAAGWARRFAAAGTAPPYWEVGNEIYLSGPRAEGPNGRRIYSPPEEYARDFARYREAILSALPAARVGAIAHVDNGAYPLAPPESRDWTRRMLRALTARADFFAVHSAYAPVILDGAFDLRRGEDRREVYRALYAAVPQTREAIRQTAAAIDRLSPRNRGAAIAVTELGPLFGLSADPDLHAGYVDQSRTLAAALYVASLLQALMDEPRVEIACYTNPVHRWYGGLVTNTGDGPVRTPAWHVYHLYRSRFEARVVPTRVSSPAFSSRTVGLVQARTGVPDLVARASVDGSRRRLTALFVNRSLDRALVTTVAVRGFAPAAADCLLLTAPSQAAVNGPSLTRTTVSPSRAIAPRPVLCMPGPAMRLELPPGSVLSLVARAAQE